MVPQFAMETFDPGVSQVRRHRFPAHSAPDCLGDRARACSASHDRPAGIAAPSARPPSLGTQFSLRHAADGESKTLALSARWPYAGGL
jgi:hypothetical protein